ncbi:MAG: hypothetical protein ACREDO_03385 [Methyloceanibacter sp.]
MSDATTHECCPESGHCDKPTNNDCSKLLSCALKCAGLSAMVVGPSLIVPPSASGQKRSSGVLIIGALAEHPPSPPPRA